MALGFTQDEKNLLSILYRDGTASPTHKALADYIRTADKFMASKSDPAAHIITSGDSVKSSGSVNTSAASSQSGGIYALAMSYELTGNANYLDKAKSTLLGWAKTNIPDGDPIATAPLIPMFKAYAMLRDGFTAKEQNVIDGWMRSTADRLIEEQQHAQQAGSDTAINNHQSYALLEIGTIGAALNDARYIHHITDASGYLQHIGVNLQSFDGEPAALGVDYHQRDAIHYVAYNLEALTDLAVLIDRLGHLPGNPYAIHYNPLTAEVNGASLAKTLSAFMPYASGELQSNHEFENSHNPGDAKRINAGTLDKHFDPTEAVSILESASYFGSTLTLGEGGKTYDFTQLTAALLKSQGKLSLPASMPSAEILVNGITGASHGEGKGNQLIIGTDGNDNIFGKKGSDMLFGGAGNDKLHAGAGDDSLYGGTGNDKFYFSPRTGHDVIHDFSGAGAAKGDAIHISHLIYSSSEEVLKHIGYDNGNAIIHLDGNNSITVTGIADHALTSADFSVF